MAKAVELNVSTNRENYPVSFGCTKSVTPAYIDAISKSLMIYGDDLIRKIKLRNLESRRKLCLVLDLDHTLIHTKTVCTLSEEEEERFLNQSNSDDIFQWDMGEEDIEYVTKLRPFVRKFLKEASGYFEMYVYTMGTRDYALNIAKLLDPDGQYFGSRIISREDCTKKGLKGLDVVHVHESGVIILDDTESVWKRHKDNLIPMDPYMYFSANGTTGVTSLSEQGIDEIEGVEVLRFVLEVLKKVHKLYFEWDSCFDVQELLKVVRNEVLEGCNIVMCEEDATTPTLRIMAEQMGAVCLDRYNSSSATHVVCSDAYTTEGQLAVIDSKFLVSPEWILEAYFLWRRPSEKQFSVCSSSDWNPKKRKSHDAAKLSEPLEKKQKC